MSKLHVNQIQGFLQSTLSSAVDTTDIAGHSDPDVRQAMFLTRALAAFAISTMVEESPESLAAHITDGPNDGGIDLVHFDSKEKTLYLVQAKWHANGHGSIEQGDLLKFLSGVRRVLDNDLSGFNSRVQACKPAIERALYDAGSRFMLVLAHTGQEPLSALVHKELEDYVASQNDTSELMQSRILVQADLHNAIAAGASGDPIDLDVQLASWGQVREPYFAVYGQVSALDVAAWLEKHGTRLFDKNLRHFLGGNSVNQSLVETLKNRPDSFWYFNNGITAVASNVAKKPLGGSSTEFGVFECTGFNVVNGAQTVGSIHAAAAQAGEAIASAHVLVRIISVAGGPANLGLEITKTTNTQNAVERSDFVALDPEQMRLARELQIDGVEYAYKTGTTPSGAAERFDLTEATIALACSHADVSLAVQAKREIGKLWEDIAKPPYRALFNPSVQGPNLWELVQLLRRVEAALHSEAKKRSGRDQLICIHGNRFIQWASIQRLRKAKLLNLSTDDPKLVGTVERVVDLCIQAYKASYSESYPASLFKNLRKCQAMAAALEE